MSDGRGQLVPIRRPPPDRGELSDEALVAACAAGDTAALGALYDRYDGTVYRFLGRLAGVYDRDLDDLVSGTFLEVFRSAARFRSAAAVRTWILGIAANLARHHVRSEARRRAFLTALGSRPELAGARPDEQAERRELVHKLEVVLRALPHDQRVAFLLCEVEGISGVDVARALGVRQGTLWRRLHDARKALRAGLDLEGTA